MRKSIRVLLLPLKLLPGHLPQAQPSHFLVASVSLQGTFCKVAGETEDLTPSLTLQPPTPEECECWAVQVCCPGSTWAAPKSAHLRGSPLLFPTHLATRPGLLRCCCL